MNETRSVLQFTEYRVLNFEYNLYEGALEKGANVVNTKFSYSLEHINDHNFSIILTCIVNSDDMPIPEEEDGTLGYPFSIKLSIRGNFVTSQFDDRLIPNALAIMFPYLRSLISTLTAQSGIAPFILPTFNIASLFRSQTANDKSEYESKNATQ